MRKSTILAASAAVVTLMSGLFGATTASADEEVTNEGQVCVMVVGKAPSETAMSPVITDKCMDSEEEAAKLTHGHTLLIKVWDNHHHSARIYGNDGLCDERGYGIRFHGFWNDRVTGFQSYHDCNTVTAWEGYYDGYHRTWSNRGEDGITVRHVGHRLDDEISSMRVRYLPGHHHHDHDHCDHHHHGDHHGDNDWDRHCDHDHDHDHDHHHHG